MRPLTDEETKVFFEKLSKYIGKNTIYLIDRADETFCFRLHHQRVYYLSEKLLKKSSSISRDHLCAIGSCFGKFTKTGKFRLQITALDHLARYAEHKIWLKPSGEMPFLYGNHVVKAHLARMSEDMPEHAGVVFYNMQDIPLGFGVSARSTEDCRKVEPTAVVAFHQADAGEYLRTLEDQIF